MVVYKKLTKDERQTISRRMETVRHKKEIDERIYNLSKKIVDTLWNEVPIEVKELYNKYPQYVNVAEYRLYGYKFFNRNEINSNDYCYYSAPIFKFSKILNNFYNNFNTYKGYSSDNHPFVLYLKEHYPALYEECREIVMDAYKINKWTKEVLCVLNNITTLNKLKDEFPEAYDAYVYVYGTNNNDCTKIDRTTGKKLNMCDAIEKVRAEFNSSIK